MDSPISESAGNPEPISNIPYGLDTTIEVINFVYNQYVIDQDFANLSCP